MFKIAVLVSGGGTDLQSIIDAVENKGLNISSLKKGDIFKLGDATVETMTDSILDDSNLNLSSNILQALTNRTPHVLRVMAAITRNLHKRRL